MSTTTTVIASGSRILGEIHSKNELTIEGEVEGRLILEGGIVVQPSGIVKGDIEAQIVKISGKVEGDVQARDHVEIMRDGRVKGNVAAPRVQINDGAFFKGAIDMSDPGPGSTVKSGPMTKSGAVQSSGNSPANGPGGNPAGSTAGSPATKPAAKGS